MKVGIDIQFALTRARTGLHNMMVGLAGGLAPLSLTAPVLLACQRRDGAYGREDAEWASAAFAGLKVILEHPPRMFYRLWHHYAAHSRMDVLVHNLHGVFPPIARGANVFIVPDLIPLTVDTGHPGYAAECLDFYRRAVGAGDAVIVLAEYTKRELLSAVGGTPDQVHVLLLGVGPEYRPLSSVVRLPLLPDGLGETPYILCVSTIEPRKNHVVLLRAFAQLLDRNPQLPHQLVLVGGARDGFDEPFALVRSLGLETRVRHLGFVESLPALYSGADLFVFPSLYEGFGLPPLEAMSCGAPVICSNATSLPEVVGDAGLLFDPGDPQELCALMARVLTEPAVRQSMREQSLRRAGQFSWSRTAAQFHQILNAAVAHRAARKSGSLGATPAFAAQHPATPKAHQ